MTFHPENCVKTLPYLGKGVLGVLLVMTIIMGITALLGKLTRRTRTDNK